MLKYEWIWHKPMATGFLNSHFAPMKAHENILIFSKAGSSYRKNGDTAMIYNPQMEAGRPYVSKHKAQSSNYGTLKCGMTINHGTRYPRDVVTFAHDREKFHPTQKPVALLEYLIKTYTNDGDIVLDNCAGSCSTGVACYRTGRRFIGFEKDTEIFHTGNARLMKEMSGRTQPVRQPN